MNRIEALCSYIDDADSVIDVGCDQANVGIMLAGRGIKSIASDISDKVISKAQEKINNLNLNDYVELRISNGLEGLKEGEADTLVIAGMGTHTLLDIVKNTHLRFKKIITISNNYHDKLRLEMNNLNYKVSEEEIIFENDKYYNLIVFVPGNSDYSDKELLLGLNHVNENIYKEYLLFLKNKYKKIVESSNCRNEKANKIYEYLKDIE